VPSGSVPGTAFSLANTPIAGTVHLFKNGARLRVGAGNDYTISGSSLTMALTVTSSDILLADYNTL
jgi:hypothetical protein